MKIKQEKVFKPLTITIETRDEYEAFVAIVDEAEEVNHDDKKHMGIDAINLAIELSNYFSNNK